VISAYTPDILLAHVDHGRRAVGESRLGTTSPPMQRHDYLALPGLVRTAPSSAMWIATRLAGSLALAFSLTK